jgi:hypothetical protein
MKQRNGTDRPPNPSAELEAATDGVFQAIWRAGRGGARRGFGAVAAAVDALLDRLTQSVLENPLDVHTAREARRRIDDSAASVGGAAAVVGAPWLLQRVTKFFKRGRVMPSAAMIAAAATTLTAVTVGAQHLYVLASLLVQRMRAEGHRVDPAFVRRVAVALYLDPGAATDAVRPNRLAPVRLATDWGSHALPFFGGRRSESRVRRAADAVEQLDLREAIARFERDRAIDLTEAARSD